MKAISKNKEMIVICVCIILIVIVSIFSFLSIKQLQGNARVVNYDGIVRGATQKLMKEEIMNAYNHDKGVDFTDDALIARLDGITTELETGEGENNLIVLNDKKHKDFIKEVRASWALLKEEIYNVRDGSDPNKLFEMSQDYFVLVNDTVFAAEAYSESQVQQTTRILIIVDSIFVLLIFAFLLFMVRSRRMEKRADILGRIAYVDALTKMGNRASCERKIEGLKAGTSEIELAVIMFDMNNLKLVNDYIGHQDGDKLIVTFATILDKSAKDYGFTGRYGGDEFLAIFENVSENKINEFLGKVKEEAEAYNTLKTNEIEKLSFAVGYTIGKLTETSIDDLIYEADRNMYANKREMKKNA
jgi:diguanylate cyclase (GGDEF)-like protein